MSKEELDQVEDTEVLDAEEDLLEFKATGEPSEVPDPVAKSAKKRPGDKTGTLGAHVPPTAPKTKVGMINAMVAHMGKMKKGDLHASYKKMMGESEDFDLEDETLAETTAKEFEKFTAADIDISEDVDAMFNGVDLDEEFMAKATGIFEAAVVAKVNEAVEKLAIEAEADVEVAVMEAVDALTEKVDDYLEYVVSEWVEENKLAIETGVRADMVEDFMKGLKNLFTEHYVDIPEDKVDVVEELVSKVSELESKLDKTIDENVELSGKVKTFEKEAMFIEATEGLTASQVEKLRSLAEGIEYSDAQSFTKKINVLKEQYFDIEEAEDLTEGFIVDDEYEPVELDEESDKGPTGAMAVYMNAISRSAKK